MKKVKYRVYHYYSDQPAGHREDHLDFTDLQKAITHVNKSRTAERCIWKIVGTKRTYSISPRTGKKL